MTQPVQEPSTERSVSGLGWGERQLARRPAPPAGTAGEWPWARRSKGFDATNQTINTDNFTDITFNHDYNMGAGDSGDGVFTTNGDAIKILTAGYYLVTAELFWFDAIGATWGLFVTQSPAAAWTRGNFFAGQTAADMMGVISFGHRFDANDFIFLTTWQDTGGDRHVDSAYLEIARTSDTSGTDYQSMAPNQ